jgi:membrane protein involved in colicin uptake
VINQGLNTYPYSIDGGKRHKQRQTTDKQRQQAEIQHNLLTQQHLDLLVNWAAAEEQRLINEELRASAEAERQESEEQRRLSEQLRISADNSYQAAEQARQAAEKSRQAAEKLRQATEEARVVAEMLRQAAEDVRQSTYEQQLVLDEMRRTVQEFARIHPELRSSHR